MTARIVDLGNYDESDSDADFWARRNGGSIYVDTTFWSRIAEGKRRD